MQLFPSFPIDFFSSRKKPIYSRACCSTLCPLHLSTSLTQQLKTPAKSIARLSACSSVNFTHSTAENFCSASVSLDSSSLFYSRACRSTFCLVHLPTSLTQQSKTPTERAALPYHHFPSCNKVTSYVMSYRFACLHNNSTRQPALYSRACRSTFWFTCQLHSLSSRKLPQSERVTALLFP